MNRVMCAVLVVAVVAAARPATAETIAITNATVYARPDRRLDGATVVIRDGKIADVGAGIAVPPGATRIDGTGKVVTAGLVEASAQLGLVEVDLEAAGNDGRFGTSPSEIHAAYRAIDAFDARSVAIPVARGGGVTSAIVGPVGGLVAGQAAWVPLADPATGGPPARAPVAMHAALGPHASALASRGYAVERLRELFDDVAAYRRARAAFDRNQSRRLVAGRLDLEALIPVLDGRLPLVIRADAEVDIRAALAVAAERKLRIVIAGGTEAWRLAKELAAARVPVLVDPTANLPGSIAASDARDDTATLLARAGVQVIVSTLGGASTVRTLRQLAGIAVANGLPWEQALAAITTVPAQVFGARDRGTLERGSVADVVVWTGDPLELSTQVAAVIIGGAVQPLASHQTRLRERYRRLSR